MIYIWYTRREKLCLNECCMADTVKLVNENLQGGLYYCCPPLLRKRGDIKSHSSVRPSLCLSVCPSVRHKNFNLGHNFCTITGRALILGMCILCDKTFPMVPCCDLDGDLWPTSRSNFLPSGGPQFPEFACFVLLVYVLQVMKIILYE